jgi:hypothetical protein
MTDKLTKQRPTPPPQIEGFTPSVAVSAAWYEYINADRNWALAEVERLQRAIESIHSSNLCNAHAHMIAGAALFEPARASAEPTAPLPEVGKPCICPRCQTQHIRVAQNRSVTPEGK